MRTSTIASGATGETAERMVRAAPLPFSEPVHLRLFARGRQVDPRKVFGVIVPPDLRMRIQQLRLSHREHPTWPVIDVTRTYQQRTASTT